MKEGMEFPGRLERSVRHMIIWPECWLPLKGVHLYMRPKGVNSNLIHKRIRKIMQKAHKL